MGLFQLHYLANNCSMSLKALNSKALFSGSLKNIVACSPTFPLKRIQGSITNDVLLAFRLSARLLPIFPA
jgi:hypothetical protein